MKIMRAALKYMTKTAIRIATFLSITVGSGCETPSMLGAENHFEGKSLELAIATESGDTDAIHRLIKDEHVNPDIIFTAADGIPLISWPIFARNLEGLRALLENGADPNARTYFNLRGGKRGYNNAMVHAAKIDDSRFLELLLKHGGDPDTRNSANEPLTLQAFLSGNQWKNVKTLIENGANINDSGLDTGYDTPLSWYTGRGGFNYAYWLLEHGADPTIIGDLKQEPARQMMVEDIYWEITTPDLLPWQRKCQQWLVERGVARPPMPAHIRRKREAFGFPTKEEDIPLL